MVHPLDYERIAIPPHGGVRIVCHNWPSCGCGDDCTQQSPEDSPFARRVLLALMIAVALIGAGLVYVGLR
ncbi:hypothetical protein [Mesorhizobium sp. B2-3-4]|uniref:hypothetical protein n=1 Tax=Mesorhizobium sp. B2-3-4 TaxID=2589959 RepID=UPI00112613B5|nr:hypothetical protein [Mesorhizobium sp. B2-3-4]TPM41573.1 hypothetical protein FJ967_01175 [Mesorhizobium sp. B2-3-4]